MARYSQVKQILKSSKLRVTNSRVDVLHFFLQQKRALTFKDLEQEFKDSDRVTLYRTLTTFSEKGVLHKIPNDSGHASYGLCQDSCHDDHHHDDHIHFKCSKCGIMECLDQKIPKISVPGYLINETNLILKGVCKTCTE